MLLFIHGAGSNGDFWHEQQAAFPDAHYVNLPGHTPSRNREGAGGGRQSVDEFAAWVQDYVESRGLAAVVLNGHSMGGAITLTLALKRPAWLRAIVLTGTGARLKVLPELLALLKSDYEAAASLIVEKSFAPADTPLTYAQKVRRNGVRRQILRTPQQVTLADYEACDRFDVMARLGQIDVPALCVAGAQDQMTPPRYSAYLHEKIEGSRLEIIEGGGHMLPMEQPADYNRVVAAFVDSLAP